MCVCVRNASEETSLPPLNGPESVSMVMNQRNREDKRARTVSSPAEPGDSEAASQASAANLSWRLFYRKPVPCKTEGDGWVEQNVL